jgi:hypothetical protein
MRRLVLSAALALSALVVSVPAATAAPAPAWSLGLTASPAAFGPETTSRFFAVATNVGAAATSGATVVEVELPAALEPVSAFADISTPGSSPGSCLIDAPGHHVSCTISESVGSGNLVKVGVDVKVPAESSAPTATTVHISGGGAAQEVTTTVAPPIQSAPLDFGFLPPGLATPLNGEDGSPSTTAGSHPFQQTVSFAFPTAKIDKTQLSNSGHPRDILTELPAGLIGNPAASADLCTEAEFEAGKCPDSSQVGIFDLTTVVGSPENSAVASSPLYNLVPPPGAPAQFGADVARVGIFLHFTANVRSDGDYGVEVSSPDTLALGTQPIFGVQAQIWGAPSAESHRFIRGKCLEVVGECKVAEQSTALWTLPASCSGDQLRSSINANSWEQPDVYEESEYHSADLAGNPVTVTDCGTLSFEPTIEAQATTNLADSPSGLDFTLHQPQDTDPGHRSPSQLKEAVVTLPQGMTVNPSQADGLAACSEDEVGFLAQAQGIHFSKDAAACPDASKLGTVEVTSPLVVQRDGEHELELDPETGEPLLEPLHGAVYLAEPLDNPFGSLLSVYLAVEDPQLGLVAKLAGRVEPDPQTGQLTTVFEENPQLPLEDVKLHLFGGARGSLITPPTCGTHATSTSLTPWSAPDTPTVHPAASFQISQSPAGAGCPGSASEAPNAPTFSAGTLTPQAGAYSPFVLKISREDGTQRLTGIDTTLPPGLSGKLAGIPECSDALIAQAQARSGLNEGKLERESPSCPASTQVGTVVVGAGAGPTPFYTQGHAYLAGPYKGAPLSLAVIVPAIAGPFDLGTVLTRVALNVDPETAQIHAVSDPLPTILYGLPLDVRSVALKMDRPDFTLNPTSCDPMAITGLATSALGGQAQLSQRFQVGGCSSLRFKPKLSLRLKGSVKRSAHPRLIATLKAKPGEANVARAQVKLPNAVFLDQSHIRTICTRVQFAADACPAGSVYGKAEATTPLLDNPLSGSVYLRSNPSHELPDLVAKLKGPASQPIEIDLAGKTDAVKAALRNTFEAVPDAPVSSFRLELFGGKRGLVEMSDGFCADRKANVQLDGQNGKAYDTRPTVGAKCPKHGKGKGHGKHRGGHRTHR